MCISPQPWVGEGTDLEREDTLCLLHSRMARPWESRGRVIDSEDPLPTVLTVASLGGPENTGGRKPSVSL